MNQVVFRVGCGYAARKASNPFVWFQVPQILLFLPDGAASSSAAPVFAAYVLGLIPGINWQRQQLTWLAAGVAPAVLARACGAVAALWVVLSTALFAWFCPRDAHNLVDAVMPGASSFGIAGAVSVWQVVLSFGLLTAAFQWFVAWHELWVCVHFPGREPMEKAGWMLLGGLCAYVCLCLVVPGLAAAVLTLLLLASVNWGIQSIGRNRVRGSAAAAGQTSDALSGQRAVGEEAGQFIAVAAGSVGTLALAMWSTQNDVLRSLAAVLFAACWGLAVMWWRLGPVRLTAIASGISMSRYSRGVLWWVVSAAGVSAAVVSLVTALFGGGFMDVVACLVVCAAAGVAVGLLAGAIQVRRIAGADSDPALDGFVGFVVAAAPVAVIAVGGFSGWRLWLLLGLFVFVAVVGWRDFARESVRSGALQRERGCDV